MRISVKEMLKGDAVRLRFVDRFSSCRINHKETVAEHSYYVGLYAALIAQWCVHKGMKVHWAFLMVRSMIHDMEEARSGDWPRPFKKSDPDLEANLNRVAKEAMRQILDKLVPEGTFNPADPCGLLWHWENAKDETVEGRIVAFADFLSVLSYISQELESGNQGAIEHISELELYLGGFFDETFSFLRPLVEEAAEFLNQIHGGRTADSAVA